jgi:hypothetical protein
VIVSVVYTGNRRAAFQIDVLGLLARQRDDVPGRSHGRDALSSDRQRFDVRLLGFAGEDLSVEDHKIGSSLPAEPR